ncbi:putative ABC transporter permease [Hominenteromicrobium sp.]|uniref:putative ABC transporter permease n=1 Tax=Hominenteromicrobium sp. TaxID=3073581 RepID=UPI0039998309
MPLFAQNLSIIRGRPMTFYDLLWYFTIYSFLGWCSEVIFATVTTGKFVNRGFLNGPVCPIYGFGMSLVLLVLLPFSDNIPLLFIGGALLTSAIELVGGWALKKFFHTTWWDYSNQPFNLGGYICLKFSILWGLCVVVVIRIVHTAIASLVHWIPFTLGAILVGIFHRAVYHGYHRHRAYHPQAQRKAHRHQRYVRASAQRERRYLERPRSPDAPCRREDHRAEAGVQRKSPPCPRREASGTARSAFGEVRRIPCVAGRPPCESTEVCRRPPCPVEQRYLQAPASHPAPFAARLPDHEKRPRRRSTSPLACVDG